MIARELPGPRYRPRRRRSAASVRERLRALATLARELVHAGTDRKGTGADIRKGRLRSLMSWFGAEGLDRAASIASALLAADVAPANGEGLFLALARAMQLGGAVDRDPSLNDLEPHLRTDLAPDERAILRGRILVPLGIFQEDMLVADQETGRVLRGAVSSIRGGCVTLASKVVLSEPGDVPRVTVVRPTPGVAVGPGSDRRLLERCESSLPVVASSWWAASCRPFGGGGGPRWIGPVTRVDLEGSGAVIVEDRAGFQARLDLPVGEMRMFDVDHVQYILAWPGASRGRLVLAPVVLWSGRGRRRAVRVDAFAAAPPREEDLPDPLLLDVTRLLTDALRTGLARAGRLEGRLRPLAGHLRQGGFSTLAALLDRVAEGGSGTAGAAVLAGHLAACSRRAIRWFDAGDAG